MIATTAVPVWTGVMLLALSGCGVEVSGESVAESSVARVVLPFTPTIAERSNERNSGTRFEPCVAYLDAELRSIGADPSTLSDAAKSDSPNYRGCHWTTTDKVGRFSQIVGDEESTDRYKQKQYDRDWQPDRTIAGRTVIVAPDGDDGCYASFMSERAMVHSTFYTYGPPSEGLERECEIAIKWATMAIAKAP